MANTLIAKRKPRMKNYLSGVISEETACNAVQRAATLIHTTQASMYDIIDGQMVDLKCELQEAGMFKMQTKHNFNQAREALRKAWTATTSYLMSCDKKHFYVDLLDVFNDSTSADVTKLYYTIKNVLDKGKVEQTQIKARIATIATIIDLQKISYDTIITAANTISGGMRVGRIFSEESPYPLRRKFEELVIQFGKFPQEIMDAITSNANYNTARAVLLNKLCLCDNVEVYCKKVLQMNPDTTRRFAEIHPEYTDIIEEALDGAQ